MESSKGKLRRRKQKDGEISLRWEKCELKKRINQTKDALGNLADGTWRTEKTGDCRHTPWTDEQIKLEGREVTENIQQFILRLPYEQFPKESTHISVNGGILQEIDKVVDLSPRWTLIRVKVSKR